MSEDTAQPPVEGMNWTDLQKEAKARGLNSFGVKRPELEKAVVAARAQESVAGEAQDDIAALEEKMAALTEGRPEPEPEGVDALPDLAKGEAPPPVEEPQQTAPEPPEPAEQAEPEPEAAQQPEPAQRAAEAAPADAEGNGKYPTPPVMYFAHKGFTLIDKQPKAGRRDSDGIWHEGIPGRSLTFEMAGRDPVTKMRLYAFRATEPWQVRLIEDHDRRAKKLIWSGREGLAQRKAELQAAVGALQEFEETGDPVSVERRIRAAVQGSQIVTGPRTTRNPIPSQGAGPFIGLDALLADQGRLGAAARDAIRTAEAKGQI